MPSQVVDLDIGSAKAYMSSMGVLRQAITLGRERSAAMLLVLRVRLLYAEKVTLYMKASNMYIVAFGVNPVFALADATEDIPATLRASGAIAAEIPIRKLALGSDHNALGTDGHTFGLGDLAQCSSLALYDGTQGFAMIRKPLSLLVCMLAEAARFLEVQNSFAGISRKHGEFWARPQPNEGIFAPMSAGEGAATTDNISISGVVWVWQKASRLRQYATTAGVGPEGGKKLVAQLSALIAELCVLLGPSGGKVEREVVLASIANSPARLAGTPSPAATKLLEAKQLAARFGAQTKEQISDVLALFGDELVMRATQGLLLPAV
ncbi:ribosome-inactivating family protein [uncultured Paludibaculum sp.]|uniref:ribosome-inactivating family protein n=1 Tax=uncultured Paludibaculum sp. TaxID=1765020 RepID=UPI002AAAF309|nr:ribosome-inactivating family protein [uncultured Paludibaculum sp.]